MKSRMGIAVRKRRDSSRMRQRKNRDRFTERARTEGFLKTPTIPAWRKVV
jgi:hypothetical protein